MENKCIKDLSKLFVWVPASVGTSFVGSSTEGSQQVYFEEGTGKIWVNGKAFGVSSDAQADLTELKNILAGFTSTTDPVKAYSTVADALATLKSDLIGGATTSGDTLKKVEDRVVSIENLIGAAGDDNATIDKLQEVLDWFKGVSEAGSADQPGVQLIADVAAAKTAIGEKATAAVGTEGEEGYVPAKPATGLYKEIEDAVAAAAGDSAEIAEDLGDVENLGKDSEGEAKEGSKVAGADNAVDAINKLDDAILAMDVAETTVKDAEENEVVSFKYKEADGVVTISDLTVVTKSISSVGLTKDASGKYVAGSASEDKGLATAADVAAEIVSDEEVIAAAFNDYESRLATVENLQIWSIYGA